MWNVGEDSDGNFKNNDKTRLELLIHQFRLKAVPKISISFSLSQ